MRRNDVSSTSFRRHVPTSFFFINQCQIITFLILKSDIIENSRIELRGIVLPVFTNQIKAISVTFLPLSTWYICDFYLFHIEIEGKGGCIIGGGGKGYVAAPPSQIIVRVCCPPSSYAYVDMQTALSFPRWRMLIDTASCDSLFAFLDGESSLSLG